MSRAASPLAQKDCQERTDLPRLIALVQSRPPDRLTDFPSTADLQEKLASPDPRRTIRLWEDAGQNLVSFAILEDYQSWIFLTLEILAALQPGEILPEMITWAEGIVRSIAQARNSPLPLEVHLRAQDQAQIALILSLGFEQQPGGAVSLSRSLSEPIPVPSLPVGFTICPSAGEPEAPEWVSLHRLAWGTENMTLEERLAMLKTPFYDPSLDLVALAPDGSLAAYCVCWFSEEENLLSGLKLGYTDPVATHPVHQRRGLAKALLLKGLSLLQARGLAAARMGTSQENTGMLYTAHSVGFRVLSETLWFSKNIAAG